MKLSVTNLIFQELASLGSEEKRNVLSKFFKTRRGEYAEGDKFMGVVVPDIRKVAKKYLKLSLYDIQALIKSPWHEMRMCGLLIMVEYLKIAKSRSWLKCHSLKELEILCKEYFVFYLKHTKGVNNWDLVDLTAPTIVGDYLMDKDRSVLYELADSKSLWKQRIAIVSTYAFIRRGDCEDTYQLALKLLHHPHDLIQKAVGWMLREAGKRNQKQLTDFLCKYAVEMPRTMLRYAIEKYPETERKNFLNMKP
ncbi:MAG: DNA alkylation repair protein [Phocaeicola sp.]|uniref:DNA alkylation repair protein n=1 Tax=Phocaeicola sp. TaxID=2773926 RepID=UPI003FA0A738